MSIDFVSGIGYPQQLHVVWCSNQLSFIFTLLTDIETLNRWTRVVWIFWFDDKSSYLSRFITRHKQDGARSAVAADSQLDPPGFCQGHSQPSSDARQDNSSLIEKVWCWLWWWHF